MPSPRILDRLGRFSALASAALVAVTLAIAVALVYQFYVLVWSEQVMASRARAAYATYAAAELSRQAARSVEDESRRILLPIAAAAVYPLRPPEPPSAVLAAAARRPTPGDSAAGLLQPWLAFRLDLGSGELVTAAAPRTAVVPAAPVGWPADSTEPARWIPELVRRLLAERRASGVGEHGTVVLTTAGGHLVAFATVPGADGGVRLVYGLVAEADAVVHDVAARIVVRQALLPLAPLEGADDEDALVLSVLTPGGRVVFAASGRRVSTRPLQPVNRSKLADEVELVDPVEVAMSGPLAPYTVRASLAPELASEPAGVAWRWTQAQTAIALLALCAGIIAITFWRLRRERAMARLRSDFVASVSHELRTPLAQIRMFSEMLRLGWVRSEAERVRAVAIIDQEARRLSNLVENVLQFSGSEERPRRLMPQPVRLATFLAEVVHGFGVLLAPRETRIQLVVDDDITAYADQEALRQVLLNLLDNALKYGPPGQAVTVGAESTGAGGVRLWVEDEGPGIPPADRRRVFEPYRRSRRDVDAGITGSGIGLTVVRDIVRTHGGAVWVEEGASRGARVVITLPPAPAAVPARSVAPAPADRDTGAEAAGGPGAPGYSI
jgi:signal transduction histidine kinase